MTSDIEQDLQSQRTLDMTYDTWVVIAEPPFFATSGTASLHYWRGLQGTDALADYLHHVTILRVDDDTLYKLNGNQRKTLWASGELAKPRQLRVDVYDLSQQAFDDLYARLYAEQRDQLPPHEGVIAVCAELGLAFHSERIKKGFISEAINIALRGKPRAQQDKRSVREKEPIDIKKAIDVLQEELLPLDAFNPKPEIFLTGVLAAALIMLAVDKKNVTFFQHLNALQGQVSPDGLLDPVEALLSVIDSYKNKRIPQVRMQMELCGKTVKAVQLWNHGPDTLKYWSKNTLRLADYLPFIREMKRKKGIHEVRVL